MYNPVWRENLSAGINKNKIFFVHYLTEGEGQVFGIGSKIFTIAGPVILYGIVTSWILGLGMWIINLFS